MVMASIQSNVQDLFSVDQANLDKTSFVGDLLITFKSAPQAYPGRTESLPWLLTATEQETRLWLQPTSKSWNGFPYKKIARDNWHIWLLGEVFPGPKVLQLSGFQGENYDPLLALIKNFNGNFLCVLHYKNIPTWHIVTNRFGTLHAYYALDGNRAALGTFSPSVAAAASKREIDWNSLTGFFAFSFFPQNKTYYTDVQILQPATHYIFGEDGQILKQERYWQWWHEPERKRSYQDTLTEFADIFHNVMTEQTKSGRIAVPISGGLDSRSTVAAVTQPERLSTDNPNMWFYSYGYTDNSIETQIASKVAISRQLPFQLFTIKPYLFDKIDQIVDSVEGFQDLTQCRSAAVFDDIHQRADYVIAAHWGDVWLDDMGLVKSNGEKLSEEFILNYTFNKISKQNNNWLLHNLCQPQFKNKNIQDILRSMVKQELDPLSHLEDQDFRVKAFKTNQWSFRWTEASLRMFQAGAFPRLPFYDNRIADFFCTVPSAFVSQRRLQIDYLKQVAPDLAWIKWQPFDTNLYRYHHFHTWLLPKRAWKKAWRLIRRKTVISRNWEVQFLNPMGRTSLEYWLLRPRIFLHEFVSPAVISDLLHNFYSKPTGSLGYTVSMLLTFSVWLEQYG
jgi:asparagine synthase (glutamine-hydrolysing)